MKEIRGERSGGELWVCRLGTLPYRAATAVQRGLWARRLAGELPDTLLLLEHEPVYTRGRRSAGGDLPLGEDFYRARGIDVVTTDRGGQLTYHGPGQLVGYAIMTVEDVGVHLRAMEGAIIAALAHVGVTAHSRHDEGADYTGVWVQARKIASIGVHVSRAVSTHGFAVNVANDLRPFEWVVACGLPDVEMTSLARELSGAPGAVAPASDGSPLLAAFGDLAAEQLAAAHALRPRRVSPARLGIARPRQDAGLAIKRAPLHQPIPRPAVVR